MRPKDVNSCQDLVPALSRAGLGKPAFVPAPGWGLLPQLVSCPRPDSLAQSLVR